MINTPSQLAETIIEQDTPTLKLMKTNLVEFLHQFSYLNEKEKARVCTHMMQFSPYASEALARLFSVST